MDQWPKHESGAPSGTEILGKIDSLNFKSIIGPLVVAAAASVAEPNGLRGDGRPESQGNMLRFSFDSENPPKLDEYLSELEEIYPNIQFECAINLKVKQCTIIMLNKVTRVPAQN